MNIHDIVTEIMQNRFQYWKPYGDQMESRMLVEIDGLSVEALRIAPITHISLGNIPEVVQPTEYTIDEVVFHPDAAYVFVSSNAGDVEVTTNITILGDEQEREVI